MLADAAAGRFPPADGQCLVLPPDAAGTWALVAFTGRAYVLGDVDPGELARQMPAGEAGGYGGVHDPAVASWVARQAGPGIECGVLDAVLVHDLADRRTGIADSGHGRDRELGAGPGPRVSLGLGHRSARETGVWVHGATDDGGVTGDRDVTELAEVIVEVFPGAARWEHPRLVRARQHRRDVRGFADDAGVVAIGYGLTGRLEVAVERDDVPAGSAVADNPAAQQPGRGRRLIEHALDVAAIETDERWCWAQVAPGNARSLRSFLAAGFVPIGSEQLLLVPGTGR